MRYLLLLCLLICGWAVAQPAAVAEDCNHIEDRYLNYIQDLEQKLHRGELIGSEQDVRPKNLMQQVLQVLRQAYAQQDHVSECRQLDHLFARQFQYVRQPSSLVARGALAGCTAWLQHHATLPLAGQYQTILLQEWPMLMVRTQLQQKVYLMLVRMGGTSSEPVLEAVEEYTVTLS